MVAAISSGYGAEEYMLPGLGAAVVVGALRRVVGRKQVEGSGCAGTRPRA